MAILPGGGLSILLAVKLACVVANSADFEWHGECTDKFRKPNKFPANGDPQHYNGITINRTCFSNSSYDRYKIGNPVFFIGDWGGLNWGIGPVPADHTKTHDPFKRRGYNWAVDHNAQWRVSGAFNARGKYRNPDYVINVGDNFYWGGVDCHCGNMYQRCDTKQWKWIYEEMWKGPGIDDKPWLGVLGNHDWGGWQFNKGWDQVIAYSWGQSPCSCDRGPALNTQTITGDDGSAAAASVSEADAGGGGGASKVFQGNATYEGAWLNGQKHGHGVLIGKDGAKYVGQFQNDKKEGQGVYYYPSGAKYTGQWVNDMQEGHGKEEWADGSVFEGEFKAGAKHGRGQFIWSTLCRYEGEFDNNDMHGEGVYTWSDGRGYSGQWTHNTMAPKGKMWWSDGRTYVGEFVDGRKHGEGTLTWPDGRSYSGQWQDGKQHGNAVAQTAKGLKRQSVWKDGKFVQWTGGVLDDPAPN